jgi:chromosome partitioning protein
MRIITIASQKGGVGKTTTAATLAHGLALKGKETLLVDLDPQGQCASILGRAHEPGVFNLLVGDLELKDVVRTTGRSQLSLLPGDKRTATAQLVLAAEGRMTLPLLAEALQPLARVVDYVVVDTAPTVGGLQEAALYAADLALIPTACDYLSAEGVGGTITTLDAIRKRGGRAQLLGVLPTFYDDQTRESQATLANLRDSLGADAVLPPVHRATVLREAAAEGHTIFEHSSKTRAAEEYAALVWRIIDHA